MPDFYHIVKDFIAEKKLKPLSSLGEKDMRLIGFALKKGDIDVDAAVNAFLQQREYRLELSGRDIEELKKKLK